MLISMQEIKLDAEYSKAQQIKKYFEHEWLFALIFYQKIFSYA